MMYVSRERCNIRGRKWACLSEHVLGERSEGNDNGTKGASGRGFKPMSQPKALLSVALYGALWLQRPYCLLRARYGDYDTARTVDHNIIRVATRSLLDRER